MKLSVIIIIFSVAMAFLIRYLPQPERRQASRFLIFLILIILAIALFGCTTLHIEYLQICSEGNATITIDMHKVVTMKSSLPIPFLGGL